MFYMFWLYHFSLKCIIKNFYFRSDGPLNRILGINAKKCLYEGLIVPMALYGAEACTKRSAERRYMNVLEMK